ncbi:MAG: hypothetical protein JW819_12860 [Candidatus Krumholzibacteriota bacterium]|nr:hypothetical protein [Candidatus Krumholzibacteriota bacterium]
MEEPRPLSLGRVVGSVAVLVFVAAFTVLLFRSSEAPAPGGADSTAASLPEGAGADPGGRASRPGDKTPRGGSCYPGNESTATDMDILEYVEARLADGRLLSADAATGVVRLPAAEWERLDWEQARELGWYAMRYLGITGHHGDHAYRVRFETVSPPARVATYSRREGLLLH